MYRQRSRRNRSQRQNGRKSYSNYGVGQEVAKSGLSIQRSVDPVAFETALGSLEQEVGLSKTRAAQQGKDYIFTVLHEDDLRKNSKLLRDVDTQDVIDGLYSRVPSLRKKLLVDIGGLAVDEDAQKLIRIRPIVVNLCKESIKIINTEQAEMREVIEEMSHGSSGEFEWTDTRNRVITIGNVGLWRTREPGFDDALARACESVASSVSLGRADFSHN